MHLILSSLLGRRGTEKVSKHFLGWVPFPSSTCSFSLALSLFLEAFSTAREKKYEENITFYLQMII